jgi:lipoate-protein ligase A
MTDAWRFIDTSFCSATYNMALDEAIATAVRKDNAPPTLRLYGWNVPSVSIGCFQKTDDIDIDYCVKKHVPIVRRPTGGRAILHNIELTYSFSSKTSYGIFSKGLLDSYKKISYALGLALTRCGFSAGIMMDRKTTNYSSPLCFQLTSYGEISISNKKIIGSAQKRWTDGLLQQGSIPYIIDKDEMIRIFRLKSTHIIREARGLKEIFPESDTNELKNAIRTSYEEIFDKRLIISDPTQEEISLAQEFEFQKYLSHQWNFKR